MPASVRRLFDATCVGLTGVVPWGTRVPLGEPGVYVVAMSDDPDAMITSEQCPVSDEAVDQLLAARPELRLDGARPTRDKLATRLAAMWLPSETVLYVGLASASTSSRVAAYYRTPLGARSPRAGGWPLKTLSMLANLGGCFLLPANGKIAQGGVSPPHASIP